MNLHPPTPNPGEAIDCNAFAGSWPFRFLGDSAQPSEVERKLRDAGIHSAWISSLDALFNAEPYTANDWLFERTTESSLFQTVPVFNPTLTGAETDLAKWLQRKRPVPAIRLAPGYHGYTLEKPEVRSFIQNMAPDQVVIITLRIQDRRAQPPLFPVPDVNIEGPFTLAEAFPDRNFLLCGVRLGEVTRPQEKWRQLPNLHIETSFLDSIGAIPACADIVGDERLHLGTLAPLFYPSASIEKIRTSGMPENRIRKILTGLPVA